MYMKRLLAVLLISAVSGISYGSSDEAKVLANKILTNLGNAAEAHAAGECKAAATSEDAALTAFNELKALGSKLKDKDVKIRNLINGLPNFDKLNAGCLLQIIREADK
jgi:hypothetical protein